MHIVDKSNLGLYSPQITHNVNFITLPPFVGLIFPNILCTTTLYYHIIFSHIFTLDLAVVVMMSKSAFCLT